MARIRDLFVGATIFLGACSSRSKIEVNDASKLTLSSAIVAPAEMLSCHGVAFCRETTIGGGHDDVREEAREDCDRHGGDLGAAPCSRANMTASCTTGGEAGPIRVFAYRPNDVGMVSELCEQFEGTFSQTP